MKKKFALIMCAVMLFGAMFAYIPASAQMSATAKIEVGVLAITEVAPNPEDGTGFEYIEVMNTGDTALDLNDYYVYRYMFSHGGRDALTGLGQIMGITELATSCLNTTAFALNCGSKTLYKNDIALVWFKVNAEDTVDSFVTYWNGKGGNVTADDVAVVDISGTTHKVENRWSSGYGTGFLPDSQCGYLVSLINKSFAEADAATLTYDESKHVDTSETAANTQARHKAADSMTVIYATSAQPGKVANRYGYFDLAVFEAARTAANAIENERYTIPAENFYPSLMMPRPAADGSVDVSLIRNTYFMYSLSHTIDSSKDAYFLNVTPWETATPSTLVAGQFGNGNITPTTDVKGTGLAMTEVCIGTEAYSYSGSENTDHEFVEVTNTTANPLTLTDYRLVLLGRTNSGKYDGSIVDRVILGGSNVEAEQHGFATIETVWHIKTATTNNVTTVTATQMTGENAKLGASDTALIWFNNTAEILLDLEVEKFANFWIERGNDMNGVIVAVASYVTGTNDTDLAGTSIGTRGNGFLPDSCVAYSLSLVNVNKVDPTVLTAVNADSISYTVAGANVKAIVDSADSSAMLISKGGAEKNVSCNFYGYIDKAKYMQDAQGYSQNLRAASASTPKVTDAIIDPSYNTVVMKGQPLYQYINMSQTFGDSYYKYTGSTYSNTYSSSTDNAVFVKTAFDSVPTPGKLLDGQFGYDAHAESDIIDVVGYQTATASYNVYKSDGETVAYIATDVRIIGWISSDVDISKYEKIVIEVAAAEAETNAKTMYRSSASKYDKISNAVCTKQITLETFEIYDTLLSSKGGFSVSDTGKTGGKLFAINLSGIPVNNCNLTFRCYLAGTLGVENVYTGMYQITDTSV